MIQVGEIIGKMKVTEINGLTYGVSDKKLNDFLGLEMPLIVKKKDLERLKKEIERGL